MPATIENASLEVGTKLDIRELTEGRLDGSGVFDVLLKTIREHLQEEVREGRLSTLDYSSVLVESLGTCLQHASAYALAKSSLALELLRKEQDILLVKQEILKSQAETERLVQDTEQAAEIFEVDLLKRNKELEILGVQLEAARFGVDYRAPAELTALEAQTSQVTQETAHQAALHTGMLEKQAKELLILTQQLSQGEATINKLATETVVTIKEAALVDARIHQQLADTQRTTKELALQDQELILKQVAEQDALKRVALLDFELVQKNPVELQGLTLQNARVSAETELVGKDLLLKEAQMDLYAKDLDLKAAQLLQANYEFEFKLPVEIAALQATKANTESQTALYVQKTATEKASTDSVGVDPDSHIGTQIALNKAQADGFKARSIQDATKVMVDAWSTQFQDDPSSAAPDIYSLNSVKVSATVQKMLTTVGVVV